jgi:hypothetical protein
MGLCSWLHRSNYSRLDLDSLLSVELPPFQTERERTQLITAAYISYTGSEHINDEYVRKFLRVINLSPILEKTVKSYFLNANNVARFLCYRNQTAENSYGIFELEAEQIFGHYMNDSVGSMIKDKRDLEALASYASSKIKGDEPDKIKKQKNALNQYKNEMNRFKKKNSELENKIKYAISIEEHNRLVEEYNDNVDKYEKLRKSYNFLVDAFNKQSGAIIQKVIQIAGGINLESKYFKILRVQL